MKPADADCTGTDIEEQQTLARPGLGRRAGVHALMFFLLLIPRAFKPFLARRLARVMLARRPKRKRIIETNLDYCFPELSDEQRQARAEACVARFMHVLLDMGALWFGNAKRLSRLVTIEGRERLEQSLAAGRPVILLVPHSVGLEHGGLMLATQFPMLGFTSQAKTPLGTWAMNRLRYRYADRVLDRSASMLTVVRELKKGRILYYLMDEDHGARCRSVFVPYFGRPVATAVGSGKLVASANATVIPCNTHLDMKSGKYTVDIGEPLQGLTTDDPTRNCEILRNALEDMMRAAPDDYLWSLRIFQNMPCGNINPDYDARKQASR